MFLSLIKMSFENFDAHHLKVDTLFGGELQLKANRLPVKSQNILWKTQGKSELNAIFICRYDT